MRALCAAAAAAGRPTPLRRPGHWQRPAARPAPCRRAAVGVRAYQGDSSAEEAATGDKSAVDRSAAFNQLAKQLAGALASEFASNQGSVYEGLEKW